MKPSNGLRASDARMEGGSERLAVVAVGRGPAATCERKHSSHGTALSLDSAPRGRRGVLGQRFTGFLA